MTAIQIANRRYYKKNKSRIKRQTAAYAKTDKGIAVQKASQERYRKTLGSRQAKRRYKLSAKGKRATARSERSVAGRLRHRRYEQTERGRIGRRRAVKTHRFKRLYGLTIERYLELCLSAKGRCQICFEKVDKLVIDHCHSKTGTYRGLLCNRCNVGIGMLKDSPKILMSAARYLIRTAKKQ